MRMTSAELQMLRNQRTILSALSILVPREEATVRIEITKRICETTQACSDATTWPEGRR